MKTPQLPPLTKTGERRLLKLIEFLEKLPRKKFNFGAVVSVSEIKNGKECGSVGCAIGWTPVVFPKLVQWNEVAILDGNGEWAGVSTKTSISLHGYSEIATHLFGTGFDVSVGLFTPNEQKSLHPDLPNCGDNATPKQVARMLRKFIKLTK